jgi:hypothetical protein
MRITVHHIGLIRSPLADVGLDRAAPRASRNGRKIAAGAAV